MFDWKKALVIFSILSSIKQDRTLEAACPRLVFTSCCQIIAIGGELVIQGGPVRYVHICIYLGTYRRRGRV